MNEAGYIFAASLSGKCPATYGPIYPYSMNTAGHADCAEFGFNAMNQKSARQGRVLGTMDENDGPSLSETTFA